jgi:A/G-specific adenine glycosylase
MNNFAQRLLDWYDLHGRHDLPWQKDKSPYLVWISEIMLQQTQVATVIPYYQSFIQRFPDLKTLANADEDQVLHAWTGLGYYSRARNILKTARLIQAQHQGVFPKSIEELMGLPGIGRSTAGAILSICHNLPVAILDGNVKRVLCRHNLVYGWPGHRAVEKVLWTLATDMTPKIRVADYTQGIMDVGATICTRRSPDCDNCPFHHTCLARQNNLTDLLPEKKTGKPLPNRQIQFAMIENELGELLLQKRPETGVWAGLWGFPECQSNIDIKQWVENKFGYAVTSTRIEDTFVHTFSHFRLEITPVRLKCESKKNMVNDSNGYCWYLPGSSHVQLGMAAPVKKLVEHRL